jgi:hypothetical protein
MPLTAWLLLALAEGCPRNHPPSAAQAGPEACVDRWLESRGLDPYGMPKGTVYAGGSPLFDEQTGERGDRLEFVFFHHPEAREACAPGTPPHGGT